MGQRREGLIIAGPTGSGKSALALKTAQKEGGVILNADSVQLYAGLPLLTAQPSASDRESAPHLLYEIFPPEAPLCSAARWSALIKDTFETAIPEGALAILVGGTGFYLQALTQGLSPIPSVPEVVRQALEQWPLAEAYRALESVDPAAARRLHPQDRQRVIRALSVWEATGKSLSDWQNLPRVPFPYSFRVLCLLPPRDVLHQRLEKRLHQMVREGVFEEVRAFGEKHPELLMRSGAPLNRALGFREIQAFWQGHLTHAQALQKMLEKTKQYAKRQETWFRHQLGPDTLEPTAKPFLIG